MTLGRPTKYDPAYCEQLVEFMAQGFSYGAFAGKIHVNIDTLYEWEKVNEDFSEAKKSGNAKNLEFWERAGIHGMWEEKDGLKLNSTVWIFNMKNRHKWRDRQDVEVTNTGAPQVIVTLPANGYTKEEN